jgi:hypothetical protein
MAGQKQEQGEMQKQKRPRLSGAGSLQGSSSMAKLGKCENMAWK